MKFCDNPECELHIDITKDEDKPIFIEKAERVIRRHLCTTRDLKKIYLCDACKNAVLMCVLKKARQGGSTTQQLKTAGLVSNHKTIYGVEQME